MRDPALFSTAWTDGHFSRCQRAGRPGFFYRTVISFFALDPLSILPRLGAYVTTFANEELLVRLGNWVPFWIQFAFTLIDVRSSYDLNNPIPDIWRPSSCLGHEW